MGSAATRSSPFVERFVDLVDANQLRTKRQEETALPRTQAAE